MDLHTQAALEEYLEGRHYEQLFSWPEQGLVVYLVGSRVRIAMKIECLKLHLACNSCQSGRMG